jgi:hypothetical protein
MQLATVMEAPTFFLVKEREFKFKSQKLYFLFKNLELHTSKYLLCYCFEEISVLLLHSTCPLYQCVLGDKCTLITCAQNIPIQLHVSILRFILKIYSGY